MYINSKIRTKETKVPTVREEIELREIDILSPHACLSSQSRGRRFESTTCNIRTAFQRDRDRIVYCKAFRRLKHKTQVFLSPMGDHYRTRLTHTLEVAEIARTIARALKLNEDLTEARKYNFCPIPLNFKQYLSCLILIQFFTFIRTFNPVRNGVTNHMF